MRAVMTVALLAAATLTACGGGSGSSTTPAPSPSSPNSSSPSATGSTTSGGDTKAALTQCWRTAGAKIADDPADLRFAAGAALGANVESDASGVRGDLATYSFKPTGQDRWRLYFATPEAADQAPSFSALLADPASAVVAAYVNPADQQIIGRADECMNG
jgi:hypothetical protein